MRSHNGKWTRNGLDIVAEVPGDGAKDKGYKAAEDALQAPADLAGIFAINDPSALGARSALEKAGKARHVKIIGFDGQPEGKRAIKNGLIYADPVQFPDRIGAMTVQAILRYFDGDPVPAQQLIPTALYRQQDGANDPSLKCEFPGPPLCCPCAALPSPFPGRKRWRTWTSISCPANCWPC